MPSRIFITDTKNKMTETIHKLRYHTIFRAKTFVRRRIYSLMKFNRPTSYPYITGDGFRSLAQHIHDEQSSIDPGAVQHRDIVFVRSDLVMSFFENIHPRIRFPYVLITHNSDQNIDSRYEKYIDDKIIHWFAQNLLIEHPKCSPIPIGLMLRFYDKQNQVIELIEKCATRDGKKDLIFYSFSVETNPKRKDALRYLNNSALAYGTSDSLTREEYYVQTASSSFNASPDGNGIDCHRTWETLYLGSIPIVEENATTRYWQRIGLPVMVVKDWAEVSTLTQETLQQKRSELADRINSPALYMRYWTDLVVQKRYGYRT